ncbi:hypothetical protein [Kitasatospora sp. McL0602]|uniref:hypothetical protein n=1 Tax=Kitasatospora sp. McL0602 TaxID=3439530 RepID=UPI003F8910BB
MSGTRASVRHFRTGPGGELLCYRTECVAPAVRWADFAHHGHPRFLSTAYCGEHGDRDALDPNTTMRPIRGTR